ncbi:cytochrome P450 [Actinomadura viridis]|uniref:Cytochrome P450 n=1 Tax=Actinomadura viridis TaxID=58110 RepID=A0A931DRM2_9ACTN|nr:cytochrome P450 [Actinomadura viridis]MBG6093489.1 cytochrome P450 [Actinomadura viridis]
MTAAAPGVPADFPDAHFGGGHPYPLYERIHAARGPVRHPSGGYWVVGTHAEVHTALTRPDLFRSRDGVLLSEIGHSYDAPPTIMHTDPPEHTRYRALVAPAFRPSVMRRLEGAVRERIGALLDPVAPGRPFDVVAELAVPLPLQVICLLLGVPEADWARFHLWSEAIVPGAAPELAEEERGALAAECARYLIGVAHERRADPRDDVISQLALAAPDGDRLTDPELAMFLIQLLVAGNETTRHAISGGLLALAGHPGQWAALRAGAAGGHTGGEDTAGGHTGPLQGAVEEILRWTSPVVYFLRTATRPVTLGGAEIAAGDRLMLLYGAANRDPAAFGPDAGRFDIARRPAVTSLAFGFGPHFCLGAALARMELGLLLAEAAARYERIETAGDPVPTASTVVTGLRRCPLVVR